MVLEYLISPKNAERKPWQLFLLGLLYPSIAIILSLWVFKNNVSLTMIALTTIAMIPLVYNSIKREEKKDLLLHDEKQRLREHSKVLRYYLLLFLGSVVAFALWYTNIPPILEENVFGVQQATIQGFDQRLLGDSVGNAVSTTTAISTIFFNNLKILIFCLVFSLFFGAGALYILTLNASVIGTALGMYIKNNLTYGVLGATSLGLLRYATHGIFEIAGYFLGGLAGGIISIAIIRHEFMNEQFKTIIQDSTDLVLLATLLLFFGALVEVSVTPYFY